MKKPDVHVFEQSRAVAAIGLMGVVGGIGLALMLARILAPVGFAVAIAGSLCVFWLYFKHLNSAYRAIAKRIPYRGPSVAELIVINALAVLMMGISIAVFSIVSIQEPPTGRAVMEFAVIQRTKLPLSSATGTLNIEMKNTGSLSAERVRYFAVGHVRSAEIDPLQLKKELAALERVMEDSDRNDSVSQSQILPGRTGLITLQDIDLTEGKDSIGKQPWPGVIKMSDDDWRNFEELKSLVYVLYASRYEDEGHPNAYWVSYNCIFFAATTSYWHNCGGNRIDLVRSPRPSK